ncbi:hypothetical protein [Marinovum sp.]|uniref:hypothetical protein n=1 Tax=Marinovum sp. TaxID=2024839 RepID=UPI003A8F8A0A
MRALLGLIGLVLGGLMAVALFGTLGHLRQVAPEHLPPWTAAVSDGSGVISGQAELPGGAAWPGALDLSWTWAGLEGTAPRWRLVLAATGASGSAHLAVPAPFERARLSEGRGSLDLSALPLAGLGGEMRLETLDGVLVAEDLRAERLTGAGRILGASYEGVAIGDGTFDLATDAGGAWRMRFATEGPAGTLEGRLSGLIGGGAATLEAEITPGAAMSEDWRQTLDLLADRQENGGWRVRRRFDLR